MHPVRITAKLSVAKQPAVEDFSALAAAGFTAIINNRPNGEEEGQPGSAAEQHAAQAAGLAYSHIPVTGPNITEADVRRFQSAVAGATGPVLGHCKSGTRSLMLWVIGEVLDGRDAGPPMSAPSAKVWASTWKGRRRSFGRRSMTIEEGATVTATGLPLRTASSQK